MPACSATACAPGPVELECRMESSCETCAYFQTGTELAPVLVRQRDHARDHNQPDRAALFNDLINRTEGTLSLHGSYVLTPGRRYRLASWSRLACKTQCMTD